MKKIVELEDRWRAYKYKTIVFYIFIIVFIVFIVFVGFFIKFQYDRYATKNNVAKYAKITQTTQVTQQVTKDEGQLAKNTPQTSNMPQIDSNVKSEYPLSVNFVCRKVIVDKLNVRKEASFRSQIMGHYVNDAIFCAENKNVNGLLKTNNGWVSANNNFSQIVEVNMFVDSGFHKSQNDNKQAIIKEPIKEAKVFANANNTPTQYPAPSNMQNNNMQNLANSTPIASPATINNPSKPIINISSEKITKEKEIELKQSDFRKTNNYDTAIEIAEYYYKMKDYKNAIKWALNASDADSNHKLKTESWIIYAKSLYVTGKKEQAIEVLSRYIANTNSRDALDVLNNMKQGII